MVGSILVTSTPSGSLMVGCQSSPVFDTRLEPRRATMGILAMAGTAGAAARGAVGVTGSPDGFRFMKYATTSSTASTPSVIICLGLPPSLSGSNFTRRVLPNESVQLHADRQHIRVLLRRRGQRFDDQQPVRLIDGMHELHQVAVFSFKARGDAHHAERVRAFHRLHSESVVARLDPALLRSE